MKILKQIFVIFLMFLAANSALWAAKWTETPLGFVHQNDDPVKPGAGTGYLYSKKTRDLYWRDESGAVRNILLGGTAYMNSLMDVEITAPEYGQVLIYDDTSPPEGLDGLWVNVHKPDVSKWETGKLYMKDYIVWWAGDNKFYRVDTEHTSGDFEVDRDDNAYWVELSPTNNAEVIASLLTDFDDEVEPDAITEEDSILEAIQKLNANINDLWNTEIGELAEDVQPSALEEEDTLKEVIEKLNANVGDVLNRKIGELSDPAVEPAPLEEEDTIKGALEKLDASIKGFWGTELGEFDDAIDEEEYPIALEEEDTLKEVIEKLNANIKGLDEISKLNDVELEGATGIPLAAGQLLSYDGTVWRNIKKPLGGGAGGSVAWEMSSTGFAPSKGEWEGMETYKFTGIFQALTASIVLPEEVDFNLGVKAIAIVDSNKAVTATLTVIKVDGTSTTYTKTFVVVADGSAHYPVDIVFDTAVLVPGAMAKVTLGSTDIELIKNSIAFKMEDK